MPLPKKPERIAIVVSLQDTAGMLIASLLEKEFGFRRTEKIFDCNQVLSNGKLELYFVKEKQIFADYVNDIPADFLVFASRHSSKEGTPSLTVHSIGNWNSAELGGKPRQIVRTSAFLQRNYLLALTEQKEKLGLEHEVSLEVTHHGPWLEKPCVFIELGSTPEQWENVSAAAAVASAIANNTSFESNAIPCIGFGGTHYASEFTKLCLRTNYAFSFMAPKHALEFLDAELISQMLERSLETPEFAVLDWKGLGRHKEKIVSLLESAEIEWRKSRQILNSSCADSKSAE